MLIACYINKYVQLYAITIFFYIFNHDCNTAPQLKLILLCNNPIKYIKIVFSGIEIHKIRFAKIKNSIKFYI